MSTTSIATTHDELSRPITAGEFDQTSRTYGEAFAAEPRRGKHAPVNVDQPMTLPANLRAREGRDEWQADPPGQHRVENSKPIRIDVDTAIGLLRSVVEQHGEQHTTEGTAAHAKYTHEGQPSCIVGAALHEAGVPVAELIDLDQIAINQIGDVEPLPPSVHLDGQARAVLSAAQFAQDLGQTWRDALDQAIHHRDELAEVSAR